MIHEAASLEKRFRDWLVDTSKSSPRRGVPVCASAKKRSVRFTCGQQERVSIQYLRLLAKFVLLFAR